MTGKNAPDPPGLDLETLLPWFRANVAQVDGIRAEVIGHGRSNITYRIRPEGDDDRSWVLRRPPLSHVLPTAHDMAREFRVMSALRPTGYPVPETFAYCDDPEILDRSFYVMEFIDGFIATDARRFEERYPVEVRALVAEELISKLVSLHKIPPGEVGLEDFGKPAGFAARQVERWAGQLEKSKTRDRPELDELLKRLRKAIPVTAAEGIVHGDYRLDNTVLNGEGEIVGILDWEMATLGDPLTDLGMFIVYWAADGADANQLQATGISSIAITALPGFPSRDEIIGTYQRESGFDLSQIDFYVVLAYFKLAVILEGIQARFLGGGTVGEGFDQIGQLVALLGQMGLQIADTSEIKGLRGH